MVAPHSSDGALRRSLRPLAQRRTWIRMLLRTAVIAAFPAGAILVFGDPKRAAFALLWVVTVLGPSTLVEESLARTRRLSGLFPLGCSLLLTNFALCLYASLQGHYVVARGSAPPEEALIGTVEALKAEPGTYLMLSALLAVGLAVAGALTQRKPGWARERFGIGVFFSCAYLLTVAPGAAMLGGELGQNWLLIAGLLCSWGMCLVFVAVLFCIAYASAGYVERWALGGPERDRLADYLQDRLEERGPLEPPRSERGEPERRTESA
jgi:hypothetical protein